MIVISDIHGCYKTFMELLKQLPHSNICVLGDMIDRGPDSYSVVEYIKNNNIPVVKANHEDMLLQVHHAVGQEKFSLHRWWWSNGGDKTIKSYEAHSVDVAVHVEWFESLPLYLEYTNKNKQHYILSHSNINMVWNRRETHPKTFKEWCLWSRYFDKNEFGESQIGNSINVIGHTPKRFVTEDEDLIFIDTGCIYGDHGFGYLSAYDLETKEVYKQKCID